MVNVLYSSLLFKIVYRERTEHINDIQKAPQVARRLITARNSCARGAGERRVPRAVRRPHRAVVPPRRPAAPHAPPHRAAPSAHAPRVLRATLAPRMRHHHRHRHTTHSLSTYQVSTPPDDDSINIYQHCAFNNSPQTSQTNLTNSPLCKLLYQLCRNE